MNSKRPLENRESSGSPTKIRQLSNSPMELRKFKKPMTFTPTSKPSPSREEQWKLELGITERLNAESDFLSDDEEGASNNQEKQNEIGIASEKNSLEMNVLRRELTNKERQKEELLVSVQTLTEKVNLYRNKLLETEKLQRSQIRITKKTFETKVEEKEKLIYNLRCFVNDAQSKLKILSEKQGGEDSEVFFNFSNSLHPLVKQIDALQDEKVELTEKNLKLESNLSATQEEIGVLKASMKNDYVNKKEYDMLTKQLSVLKEQTESRKVLEGIENINVDTNVSWNKGRYNGRIKELGEEVKHYQEKLKINDDAHYKEKLQLETEIRMLKKKLRDAESKYTTLAYTPPKVRIKKEIDDETIEERKRLRIELNSMHRKVDELTDTNEFNLEKILKLESEETKYKERIAQLENDLTQLKTFKSLLKKEECCSKKLRSELDEKENELELVVNEFKHQEESLKQSVTKQVEDVIMRTEDKYSTVKKMHSKLKQEVYHLYKELKLVKKLKADIESGLHSLNHTLQHSTSHIKSELLNAVYETNRKSQILIEKYKREMNLRKKLHNELVELKGNIRVLCRVRPLIKEDGIDSHNVIDFDEDDDTAISIDYKKSLKQFEMDKVFQASATQLEVFNDIKGLVTSCLDGYNICIFAYGQTGSGKTYTMEGTQENPGINQRALMELFKETEQQIDWEYTILVSFMEIYNEMLRDLLSTDPTAKLEIKQGKDGLNVPGLTHVKVTGVNDVNEVFSLGRCNRATASTDMNERSSRSHSVLTITVIGRNINTETKVCGKLNLVDLAGSERVSKSGSEGLRMKEAQNINKSLSALGDVIHALKNHHQHIPYRNTKLTYLLRDSLGGDSKTLMVVQVSPVDKNASETVCSLNFAQRVRSVELGQATRKVTKQ